MDYSENDTYLDEIERSCKAILVGNLHPKVSFSNIVELFYQVGPIEFVEFPFYDRELSESFACVAFKHSSSVEDSIKLFCNTKLYGIPIITVNYSEHCKDIAFRKQPEYLKRLTNIGRSNQSTNINRGRQNDRNYSKRNISESLLESPTQNRNSSYKNKHNFSDKIYHSRGSYRKSNYNRTPDSIKMSINHRDLDNHQNNDRILCGSRNYDRKHQDYNKNQDKWPVKDLRDTINRRKKRRSERKLKNEHHSSDFSDRVSRKKYYNSERYIKSTTRYTNYNYDRHFCKDKPYVNLHEYKHTTNNYNREKYTSHNNNKYNCMQSQNRKSNSHHQNSFHPYKQNNKDNEKK